MLPYLEVRGLGFRVLGGSCVAISRAVLSMVTVLLTILRVLSNPTYLPMNLQVLRAHSLNPYSPFVTWKLLHARTEAPDIGV